MAKTKKGADAPITLEFLRTGNPWIDAGIVGLYRVLNRLPAYVDDVAIPDVAESRPPFPGVRYDTLSADRLVVSGPADQVQACLEWAYDRLVAIYYDVSSQKQKESKEGFYYETKTGEFVAFARKRAVGAALLLFDKSGRLTKTDSEVVRQIKWASETEISGKKNVAIGRLPVEFAHLQEGLDHFLEQEGLKAGPRSGLLVDAPYRIRPKVKIKVGNGQPRGNCFLSGLPQATLEEAKGTAFPLFGGSRAFMNGTDQNSRVAWWIDLVGKFVPAVAFFYFDDPDIHLFFPQSNDLRRVNALVDSLARMVQPDPNIFRNFEFAAKLGGYFSRRSEVTLAFLHRVFVELTDQQGAERARLEEARFADVEKTPLFDDEPAEPVPEVDPEPLISAGDVVDATQRDGPVGFAVVSAAKKGNVWMACDFWAFQDVVYLARLFAKMQRPVRRRAGRVFQECQPGPFFLALVDFEANDECRTLLRDRVCEAVLRRQPVLHLLERHAFHTNTKVRPLLEFARLYETELRKGTTMEDAYQAMVKSATWLGDTIGKAVADAVSDKKKGESRGQARGALFRLRKTRTTADFMNELARLQFRYEMNVPRDVLDGQTFSRETFEEFRGFCVVAALNRFLTATSEPRPTTTPSK